MSDETVNVRYMVDDVAEAVAFYTGVFGFELLSNDGRSLDYTKSLDDQGSSYGGSRSIPKRYVESGYNGVYARVYRVGGGEDRLFIHFIGAP